MAVTEDSSVQRPSPIAVFTTLLWAEYAPRRAMLRGLLLLQLLLCVRHFLWNYFASTGSYGAEGHVPYDGIAKYLVLGTIAYSLYLWRDAWFSSRPPWRSMNLPVSIHWQWRVGLGFQVIVALLAGAIWGLDRLVRLEPEPFLLPLLVATTLAVQGYTLVLWWAASNLLVGALLWLVGLSATLAAGLILGHVFGASTATMLPVVMIVGGTLSCHIAAATLQRGLTGGLAVLLMLPAARRAPGRVGQGHHQANRIQSDALAPLWSILSANYRHSFSSPFWAQCWFEWRRTAMWLPATAIGTFSLFAFIGGTDFSGMNLVLLLLTLIVPFALSFKHLQVTPQYRSFVLSRPISSRTAGRAKAVSMAFAILLVVFVPSLFRPFFAILHGDLSNVVDLECVGYMLTYYALLGIYGVFALAVALLGSLVSLPIDLLRMALLEFRHPLDDVMDRIREPIPCLDVLTTMCAAWLLLRSLGRRHGVSVPWPQEMWFPVFALLPPVLMALVDSSGEAGASATLWYIWATPFIMIGAMLAYGTRSNLITRMDRNVGWATFAVFYAVAGFCFYFQVDGTTYLVDMHFGHWCALFGGTVVWYPFAIDTQRRAGEKDISPEEEAALHNRGGSCIE